MENNEDRVMYTNHGVYYDGRSKVCPICGGKIIHPYTGYVTSEQLDEEIASCTWCEVIDEGDSTIGYTPCCKNIHPYTLASEDHNYIHYDLVELANAWNMSINDKVEKLTEFITTFFKGVEKKDVQFSLDLVNDKITDITIAKPIERITIDLGIDKDGNITVTV